MEKLDGGPAFPHNLDSLQFETAGMSLRDYFAAQALVATITNPNLPDDPANLSSWPEPSELADRRAKWCYLQADAMLKEARNVR